MAVLARWPRVRREVAGIEHRPAEQLRRGRCGAQPGRQYQALEAVAQYPTVIAGLPSTRAAFSNASSEKSHVVRASSVLSRTAASSFMATSEHSILLHPSSGGPSALCRMSHKTAINVARQQQFQLGHAWVLWITSQNLHALRRIICCQELWFDGGLTCASRLINRLPPKRLSRSS